MEQYISKINSPKVSVAPMVDRTNRHFRYFLRTLTKKTLLYTEMTTAQAIIHGDRRKLLDFDTLEKPIALQIAGCNSKEIYQAVKLAEDWDYDEINLNVGCPSDKVSGNEMGAVLMAYPKLVAEMVTAIRQATDKPVTVKHRIGIEGKDILPSSFDKTLFDQYEDMVNFIDIVSRAKVDRFTIHARIAVLAGLNPKENREIPPLRYDEVYRLKKEFPYLKLELNGGIKTIEEMREHLKHVDGVMVGRGAYDKPFMMAKADQFFQGGEVNEVSRRQVIQMMGDYVEKMEAKGEKGHRILNPMMHLFSDKRGSRKWRQMITPPWAEGYTGKDILGRALGVLPQEVLDEKPTSF